MDQEKFLQQLKKASQNVSLPPERKRMIKFVLTQHMDRIPSVDQQSSRTDLAAFLRRPLAMTAGFLLVVLAGGAGTAFASQNAIPGDPLYSFKVNFAEKIEIALATSTEARAEAELVFNERRLAEASQLLTNDKLNAQTEAVLQEQLQEHEEKLKDIVDSLEAEEKTDLAANVSARYEAILRAHQQLAASVHADRQSTIHIQGGFDEGTEARLIETINEDLKSAQSLRTKLEQKSIDQNQGNNKKSAAEGKIDAATRIVANAKSFVESARNVTSDSKTAALAQIKVAEDTLVTAHSQFDSGDYKDAFISASQTLRIAQSARSVVVYKSKSNTRVEVKNDAEFFLHHDGEVKGANTEERDDSGENNNSGSGNGLQLRPPFGR